MQCGICQRPASSSRLPFNCTLCARDALYQHKIQLAQTLLHRESLEKEVERNVKSPSKSKKTTSPASTRASDSNPKWASERAAAEQTISEEKAQTVHDHIQRLREEVHNAKIEIAERKAKLQARRSEFTSAKQELSQSQATSIDPVEKGIRRTGHRWDILHEKNAEARLFLCREVALLYGLQQRKRKKGGLGRDVYSIGGVPIPDLRDLNNASPAQVTTSITNLAHVVHLVSHYLSLRLPAEITLPHRDYPLPTIFSPGSSYTGREISFPGFTPSHSSNNSPSTSRHADQRPLSRPRPLHIDKKLSVLAKDDPLAYALFVEGITFLVWDIAWLCKTQGLNIGGSSWEEVCAMGKNLWQLLLAPPPRPPILREASSKTSPAKPPLSRTPTATTRTPAAESTNDGPPLGHFSHGTAYGYLATAAGTDYMRDWRLQPAVKVIEKVKAMLLAERTGAEWELLEGNEWEEEEAEAEGKPETGVVDRPEIEQTGILVKPTRGDNGGGGATEREEGEEKGKGWMKVKSR